MTAPAADLAAALVAIPSVNPDLVEGGHGEEAVAMFAAEWLRASGLQVRVTWPAPGRPNVVGVRRGSGGGRSLLLVGHTDTVGADGMADPFGGAVGEGRLHGRGAYDMKSGLAAAMAAAAAVDGLAGDVVVAGVCDEEAGGLGIRALLDAGITADAAIVTEPTDLAVGLGHKGYAGFRIETSGRAAHGSMGGPEDDAIVKMAGVLAELARLDAELRAGPRHPLLGTGTVHASRIAGGQEASSYPARCVLHGEWRTVPGDDPQRVLEDRVARGQPEARLTIEYEGDPLVTAAEAPVAALLRECAGTATAAMPYWADSALLAAAGIPTVLFGPAGGGAHAIDEWVDVASIERVRDVLVEVASRFCR
ncbi:MAG: M20/M25/M40 family metallo-hydrolase [Solirubrobacterales bacterium]|nr:M20/M25/M40 family metallo-hydrolase [Solirubrobacterales bacterium]